MSAGPLATLAVAPCPHCGAAVEGGGYCCEGCEMAAEILRGAGLERYYRERTTVAPRPGQAGAADWSAVEVEEREGGRVGVSLAIDGLDCAACVWVVERVLQGVDGVDEVAVSHATGRTTLRWDPAKVDLATLTHKVEQLGWRPRPLLAEPAKDRSLLLRLGIAVFSAMNVMLLSASVYAGWFDGMSEAYATLFRHASLVLATPVALWCAWPFYRGAMAGLEARVLHMDLPVSLGVVVMFGHGLWGTWTGHETYLDSLTMLVALLLGGRVLEQGGRRRAQEAAAALGAQAPARARRRVEGGVEDVPVAALRVGDVVEVVSGLEVPVDGVVTDGEGDVRMALVTGESEPVRVGPGDRVVAGAMLIRGNLGVNAERVGADSLLERMAGELVLATGRPAAPELTDRIAPYFTGVTLVLAAVGLGAWTVLRGFDVGMATMVAVLVVACPCALALASPLAVAAGLGAAARRGLLVRSGEALRRAAEVDTVVLDKTGTMTGGEPVVVDAEDAVLRVAAGLERASAHPIARAILAEARRRGIAIPRGEGLLETPGVGVEGVVDGVRWRIGAGGPTEVRVTGPGGLGGVIRLRDVPRVDAARAVAALRGRGLRVVMLTGDTEAVAARVAALCGVSEVVAAQGPEAKSAWVRARQAEGRRVLFVGDGLNDGPALAAADVGVAMGGGVATSVLVADAVVARDGLGPVVAGIDAARAARAAVRANVIRSLTYNLLAVTGALAGLVNPLVAAVLMPFSSALVIAGAARVERRLS